MFKSGAVAFTLKSEANVLCIGLGGGSINGFLHHVFPKVGMHSFDNIWRESNQRVRQCRTLCSVILLASIDKLQVYVSTKRTSNFNVRREPPQSFSFKIRLAVYGQRYFLTTLS